MEEENQHAGGWTWNTVMLILLKAEVSEDVLPFKIHKILLTDKRGLHATETNQNGYG